MEVDDVIETPPLVVIDGANVAHASTSLQQTPTASLSLVASADAYWSSRGVPCITVLPSGMERCARDAGEVAWLRAAQESGRLMMAPCRRGGDDDIFALSLAVERDGFIMTNDRFSDHVSTIATAAGAGPEDVSRWLSERVITFACAGETVTPHPFGLAAVLGRRVTRPVVLPRGSPPAAFAAPAPAQGLQPSPGYGSADRWGAKSGGGAADDATSSPLSFAFNIPAKCVGVVIGTRGEMINSIQAATGARITVSPNVGDGSPERVVTVSGLADAIASAHAAIQSLVSGASGPRAGAARGSTGAAQELMRQVECPARRVGAVIGRSGATVRGIEERTSCRVDISEGPLGSDRTIRVTGQNSDDVTAAVTELLAIIHS